ncbi:hypothetical protein DDB_G0282437 [Dictyostelium discoideum AX4]|uniref:Uncharacterized protein n=1 Tax=Dictyostelium discoideum TaxID=44689 RepID=Q54SJ0_DICDI|nr:hypothetical protein DDB_G0282437 [Dictyostelium discoideum AX4]EAL66078.1 hypothetical protein DDB_G0282437 [Dictyostelium discoideum AX4]|eukprot:XP_640049.1 hypothetical protein DDB_G0282437 [Dictyostelium discoideum AX4]
MFDFGSKYFFTSKDEEEELDSGNLPALQQKLIILRFFIRKHQQNILDLSLEQQQSALQPSQQPSQQPAEQQPAQLQPALQLLNKHKIKIKIQEEIEAIPRPRSNVSVYFHYININGEEEKRLNPDVPLSFWIPDDIILDDEEIPKVNIVDYILEPEIINNTTTTTTNQEIDKNKNEEKEKEKEKDDSFVIFCIDVSGSMGLSSNVRGGISLPSSNRFQDYYIL